MKMNVTDVHYKYFRDYILSYILYYNLGFSDLNFVKGKGISLDAYQFMPHGHCYLWKPELLGIHAISDMLIGLAYVGISITLYALVKKIKVKFDRVILAFGLFIGACGMTHFLEVWNLWHSNYWLSGGVKVLTALASVFTGVYLFKLRHQIVEFAESVKISENRRVLLESHNIELEQKVAERTTALQDAVKARDEFLSLASHELKTPLTTLKLQSQFRLRNLELNPDNEKNCEISKQFLSMIDQQTSRLNRVVEDMLDVSRIQSGQMQLKLEKGNICELINEIIRRFSPELHKTGNFVSQQLSGSCFVMMDNFRMEQVISNLFANIIKYAPRSEITVSLEDVYDAQIDQIKLTVKDGGPGIEAEKLESIFQRFERVGGINGPSGLGLGLYLSRQIVEAHGGKIWAESIFGDGASFVILLPRNIID
jgi:signal transduction histidine kinase